MINNSNNGHLNPILDEAILVGLQSIVRGRDVLLFLTMDEEMEVKLFNKFFM